MTTTVRVTDEIHKALRDLAASTGESMQEVLTKAVHLYREQRFWTEANAAYEALRENAASWKEELEERRVWDSTLGDGLSEFPYDKRR